MSVQQAIASDSIETEFFTLSSLGNMNIEAYVKDASRKLYEITLSDPSGNTYLTLKTYANAGDDMTAEQECTSFA